MQMAKLTKSKLFQLALLLIFFIPFFSLSGCGGSKETTTTGTTTPTAVDHSSLTLILPASVTYGTPVTVTATLRGANGHLVLTPTVVTFAQDSNHLVAFDPTSGTASTFNAGVATILLKAADLSSNGASTITASAPVTTGGTTATITSAPAGIAVGGAAVTLGTLTVTPASISAYGTSIVRIEVDINSVPATIPIQVAFASTCVGLGKATLTSPVTTVLGIATSTYKDNGCNAGTTDMTDPITASVTGHTASANITIHPTTANNIQFVSATPTTIGVLGSTLPQSSLVKFQVLDTYGNGKAGVLVDFSLLPLSIPGGVTLSAYSATSDASGNVTTSVNTGTVPTPVWVVAKVDGSGTPGILSQSNTLTITTGMPTQNFFSLSVQTFNIEGLDYDGVTSTLTVIASDRLGNPVPNGTAINFITPVSGQILPASCSTIGGTCTVTYKSEGSRPDNGRVTILAYAVGEKTFIDTGGYGDNSYHTGDTFYDLGDLYIDANENGQWDPGEEYLAPYASGGSSVCTEQPSGNLLTGDYGIHGNIPSKVTFVDPLADPPVPATGTCTGTWETNYVRRSAVLTLSSDRSHISPTTVHMTLLCQKSFTLTLTDINGNPMPAGTTLTTVLNYVNYTPNGGSSSPATITIPYGTPVLSTNHLGGTSFTLAVFADCSAGTPIHYPNGTVNINTTTPKGVTYGTTITVLEN